MPIRSPALTRQVRGEGLQPGVGRRHRAAGAAGGVGTGAVGVQHPQEEGTAFGALHPPAHDRAVHRRDEVGAFLRQRGVEQGLHFPNGFEVKPGGRTLPTVIVEACAAVAPSRAQALAATAARRPSRDPRRFRYGSRWWSDL